MKVLRIMLKVIFYFVICVGTMLFQSVKFVIKGKNWMGKMAISVLYIGEILLFVFAPIAAWIILALLGLGILAFTVLALKNDSSSSGNRYENQNRDDDFDTYHFFDGMNIEEAKREYRRLIKMYHPDNGMGDLEKTKEINIAYTQYCTGILN